MNAGVPMRTCIGCRGKAPRSQLLRVVVDAGSALPDPTATAPGRGSWLHRDLECLNSAEQRGGFRKLGATEIDQIKQAITS